MTDAYNEIEHKGGLSHVRARPSMYVGDVHHNDYTSALMNLLREVVGNAADEYANGHAQDLWVRFVTETNTLTVRDNGRGIPFGPTTIQNPYVEGQTVEIDKLELATGVPNTGAKYEKGDGKSFKFSIGMNGIGLKATNALSQEFAVTVHRTDGSRAIMFAQGKLTQPVTEVAGDNGTTGTIVTWTPDRALLPFDYNEAHIRRYLKETAYLNAGLVIHFTVVRDSSEETERYHEPDGINAYLRDLLGKDTPLMQFAPLSGTDETTGNKYEIALAVNEGAGEAFFPFVNGSLIETASTPVVALRQAFARTIAGYVKDHVTLPKKYAKLELRPEDFRSGLTAVIKVLHVDPSFDSQTKTKLTNTDVATLIATTLPTTLLAQLLGNPTSAEKIIAQAITQAEARIAAQKAREAITKNAQRSREEINVSLNIYTAPLSHNPDTNVLYMFEGESASGSLVKAAKARDPETGKLYKDRLGILALKGMVLNVLELDMARALKNTELATLIRVSGLNPQTPDDLSGLNFRDFYITTDMDAGGAHISILLATFFLTLFPEVIRQGRLARVVTPLFELIDLKTKAVHFIYPDEEKDVAIARLGYKPEEVNKRYTLKRNKGLGELSDAAKMTLVESPRLQRYHLEDIAPMQQLFQVFSAKDAVESRRELIFSLGLLEDETT